MPHPLKLERFLRDLSQVRLAQMAGLRQDIISLIETGRRVARPQESEAIARVLEVSPDEIFPAQT